MAKYNSRSIKTVHTITGILETIRELDGAKPDEIAERQNLARSTVYDYLATLRKERFVIKEDGKYHLGLRFLEYGTDAKHRYDDVIRIIQPTLDHLANTTDGLASLYTEEHGQAICLDYSEGDRAVITVEELGRSIPLHTISTGKVFLAYKSEDAVDNYIDEQGLASLTEETITNRTELKKELEDVRDRGFAVNNEETIRGLYAVACPIEYDREVIASLALSGPSEWLSEKKGEIVNQLREVRNEVELKLSHAVLND